MKNQQFKTPDLKIPRFTPSGQKTINKSLYDKFLKKFPEHAHLTYDEFKAIIREFHFELFQGVIDNRDGVELPEGLGFIFMGNCPRSVKENTDYAKSKTYGVKVDHRNPETDSRLLKIFYTNHASKYPFRHRELWFFRAAGIHRSRCSVAFRTDWMKYIEIDHTKKISAMFNKNRRKQAAINHGVNLPDNYDEFNMES